jgi:holliday junction DNA helicase RuvA
MIHHLRGKLIEKNPTNLVVEAGGVGYFVNISLHTFDNIKDKEDIFIYTHFIVREDGHFLFGFSEKDERNLFKQLINVSGVGASTAQVILSSLKPNEIRKAIVESNVNALKAIKGIGLKTAQRIIIDLKDKLGKEEFIFDNFGVPSNNIRTEAFTALTSLGFDKQKVDKAIESTMKQSENISLEQLIKITLKNL